jgi:predicted nucleotidyltransferase
VLASGALARLVAFFTVRPEAAPHLRALMRLTGLSARSLQLELARLERLGLVERDVKEDRRVHVRASHHHPAWGSFRHLVRVYGDPALLLHFALADVPGVATAFVFGSVAHGTADAHSDIDLCILTEPALEPEVQTLEDILVRRAVEASLALGREVNLVVLTTSQLSRNLAARRAFYENVVAGPKLWVLGDPARLASIPPARVRKTAPTA